MSKMNSSGLLVLRDGRGIDYVCKPFESYGVDRAPPLDGFYLSRHYYPDRIPPIGEKIYGQTAKAICKLTDIWAD